MIEVEVSESMYRAAWAKSRDFKKLKNSITENDGVIDGMLGEMIALSVIGGAFKNTYDYDIITPSSLTVDVKSKKVTSPPMPHYDCSVAAFNTTQLCDYYAFVRVECIRGEYKRGWYLGHISKLRYYGLARFLKKGSRNGDNYFCVRADCYNLPISELSLDIKFFTDLVNKV